VASALGGLGGYAAKLEGLRDVADVEIELKVGDDVPGVLDVRALGWTGQRSWLFDSRRPPGDEPGLGHVAKSPGELDRMATEVMANCVAVRARGRERDEEAARKRVRGAMRGLSPKMKWLLAQALAVDGRRLPEVDADGVPLKGATLDALHDRGLVRGRHQPTLSALGAEVAESLGQLAGPAGGDAPSGARKPGR
jgi:hypothetical protein